VLFGLDEKRHFFLIYKIKKKDMKHIKSFRQINEEFWGESDKYGLELAALERATVSDKRADIEGRKKNKDGIIHSARRYFGDEIQQVINESTLIDISDNHPLKRDVEGVFGVTFAAYCFKLDRINNLVGINISYLSDDTLIDPNKVTSLVRGIIRENPLKYNEIKTERGGGGWPEKYEKIYPSLEALDPDYYIVVKLK